MTKASGTHFNISIVIVGFTFMMAQIIVLRTFFIAYAGNEIGLGVVISNWLLINSFGSYLGSKSTQLHNKEGFLFVSHLLIGILPLITVFLIYYTRFVFFPAGTFVSLMDIFLFSFALLAPFCFITGFVFSFLATQLSTLKMSNPATRSYYLETIGAIAGGLIFNFFLLFTVHTFLILKFLMAFNFGVALFVTYGFRSAIALRLTGILAIGLAGFFFMIHLKPVADGYLFRYQNIFQQLETPYGNLVVTEMAGQYSFYENGIFLFSSNNTITNEESVHYAMLQHPHPENVLLVSGGMPGTVAEVLKYNVKSLDYIEINPWLIELSENYASEIRDESIVQIVKQDARSYINNYEGVYDVVLMNLPDPVNIHINRYYTLDFLEALKDKLSEMAVVSISLSSTAIYLSEEARLLHTALYSNLKLLFANVVIVPGMNNYFIASDGLVSSNIALLTRYKSSRNTYVNPFYLDDELIKERRNRLEAMVSEELIINYDFLPVAHILHLRHWLKDLRIESLLAGALILMVLALILPRLNTVQIGLFTTGFTASSLQIVMIVAFQMIYGYIYSMIGIFFTVFMIGIMAGSLFVNGRFKISLVSYSVVQYMSGIIAVLVPIAILVMDSGYLNGVMIHSVFILFILISGMLTGTHFLAGSQLINTAITGAIRNLCNSWLLGGGIGALIASIFLIPYFGIIKVGLLLGIVNFLVGLFILLTSRKIRPV
jgi:spermidine synthase